MSAVSTKMPPALGEAVQDGVRLGFFGLAPEGHGAQAQFAHYQTGRSEQSLTHEGSSRSAGTSAGIKPGSGPITGRIRVGSQPKSPAEREDPLMRQRLLGSTGLVVSELCLGTMTFGRETEEPESHAILDRFTEAGGIFVDTPTSTPAAPPRR